MTSALVLLALVACSGNDDDEGDTSDDVTDTVDTDDTDDTDTPTPTGETGSTGITVPEPTGDPATVELSGECPHATDYGGFVAEILYTDTLEYSNVSGAVEDGVVPVTVLQEVGAEGDCRLMRRNNPFCDPPCGNGETCDFDGTCIPYPAGQDMGTITVGGLVQDFVIEPVQPGYFYFVQSAPHPVIEAEQLIELRTVDSTFGGDITLHGVGVEPLDLGGVTDWTLYDGVDLPVTWTPPTAAVTRSHVHLQLNIDQHGNTPVQLFCEFDDDGSATVPTSLISQLIGFGVTGFPNATLTRRTVDSATVEGGCIDFKVQAPVSPSVIVDGYIPCNSTMDCPTGQTCDPVTFICG